MLLLTETAGLVPENYCLSDECRRRLLRLRGAAREQSLGAELLLYEALRRRYPAAEPPVSCAYREGGKPYLPDFPDFRFSLAHSGGVAACAAGNGELGVDIEPEGRLDYAKLRRYFAPEERDYIEASPEPNFAAGQVWCLREAFAKYDGRGIFALRGEFYITPAASGGLAEGKRFALCRERGYIVALCGDELENADPEWIKL